MTAKTETLVPANRHTEVITTNQTPHFPVMLSLSTADLDIQVNNRRRMDAEPQRQYKLQEVLSPRALLYIPHKKDYTDNFCIEIHGRESNKEALSAIISKNLYKMEIR
ncbi:hypothetical protein [Chitinophaga sp. HK235]|uniref:hypothetical protein n=1 Tax=Chitinophaga sp. HK235 TaxID=2952571 RepID=UPI001BABCE11|nr:hypothetical protein [Chitinophaga sp. HK235]